MNGLIVAVGGIPQRVWCLLHEHWPFLPVGIAVLVAIGWLLSWTRWRLWRRSARRAHWLEITPPVTATPLATVELWRLLATLLPAGRWWTLRAPRLVWEVRANPVETRCGLWLPPGVSAIAATRILRRSWPGVRTDNVRPPHPDTTRSTVVLRLQPTQPDWLPLVEEPEPRRLGHPVPGEDRLRAVYDGLVSAGRTGGGQLQVVVCRAPRHRLRVLRQAAVNPRRVRRRVGARHLADLTITLLRSILLNALDLANPAGPGHVRSQGGLDPHGVELARRARTKLAAAPHLLVAVLATAHGPSPAAALAAADDITSGFGLLSPFLTRRRVHRPERVTVWRWVPEARMSLASVYEVSALAGLPGEPAAHGLPSAASRRRPPSRETFMVKE